jgi:hypothetical protein
VVIGTDEFQELARLEAKNRGLPALPVVLVKHPLGGIKDDEVERKADTIVDTVAQAVTAAPAADRKDV